MNTSTIAEMIKEDPSILDDIPAFLEKMNLRNIKQIKNVEKIVNQEESLVSIADMNGGEATEKDVADAKLFLDSMPLLDEADTRYKKTVQAIQSGDVKSTQEIIEKFRE